MSPRGTTRLILCVLLATSSARAADFPVSSASDIDNALNSAGPGDTLTMTNGIWTDQVIRFTGDGNPGQPITLRAQTPGGVTLNGISRIEIGGTYLEVEGLRFEGGALGESSHIVRFHSGSTDAEHCVLRDTAIIDYNPLDRNTRYFWVSLYGTHNTVENCRFENQDHSGVTVVVWGDWPNNHVIRNNHFVDRPVGPDNGWETIRVGTSDYVNESSQTVVESNLFQRADGEIEAISNKTGDNIYRYNTFRECSATLTLRHGFSALVHGNFFIGEGASGSGGIRVIGPGHRIWNNYFEGLLGRTQGIIALEAGQVNGPNSGYEPVIDVIVAHNTIVDCNDP
ncbi:MAG: polysaccharide lyase 6 family protein, partial [Phycisphaerales bacterium]|nr:polysaccharide lyase 6 family protein [Phycisphaerales bacterium]